MMMNENKWHLFIPIFIVYGIGLFIDIMAIDPAQYSTMAMKMMHSGEYLHFYYHDQDYIDKPPLIFWTSALSFKFFGMSNFAYKLPSVLFTFLGLFSTYRLARLLYNENTAFYATLILASCEAWFMINHDVKTDTILVASTIFGLWQLVEYEKNRKLIHILWAGLGIAGAMLTKGPIGFMVPALAIGTDFILKRKWNSFFRIEWFLMLLIIFICLLPMLYGLYTQFDLTNGKETYNGFIQSGINFYFWTQSFGRITGSSSWSNETDPFYFIHTFLWAFLPWSLFFIVAISIRLKRLWKRKFKLKIGEEAITLGGTLIPILVMSFSHYKLPQYIFVVFPLAAIITGNLFSILIDEQRKGKVYKALRILQAIVSGLLIALIIVLCLCFPLTNIIILLISGFGLGLIGYVLIKKGSKFNRLVLPSLASITIVNFLLNFHIYPTLLTYQAGSVAGQIAHHDGADYRIITYKLYSDSFEFYAKKGACRKNSIDEIREIQTEHPIWIYTDERGYDELKAAKLNFIRVRELVDYPVSRLTFKFLNPETRGEAISHKYLLLI